jgi:hypothetical protein
MLEYNSEGTKEGNRSIDVTKCRSDVIVERDLRKVSSILESYLCRYRADVEVMLLSKD